MPVPKGVRVGGRQKGTPNKYTREVADTLRRLKCDPIEGMAMIALNTVPCGVCRGRGKTKYRLPDKGIAERLCESCYGTLWESCSPELRGKMYAELAQYEHPKRKAIEVTGEGGGSIQQSLTVRFVHPGDPEPSN